MSPGVDIGIDAERNWRDVVLVARDVRKSAQLWLRFDVEAVDPAFSAKAISALVLPTPEKVIRPGGVPAASARRNSPSETTSMPAPSRARVVRTAWLELAFTA